MLIGFSLKCAVSYEFSNLILWRIPNIFHFQRWLMEILPWRVCETSATQARSVGSWLQKKPHQVRVITSNCSINGGFLQGATKHHETTYRMIFCVAPWNEGSRCQRDIAYVVKVKLKLPGRSYCGSRMLSTCRFPSHGTIGGFPLQKRMRRWEKPMALVRTKLHDNFHLTFWFWEKILRNGCFFCGSFWKLQLEKTLFSSQLESETWGRHDW